MKKFDYLVILLMILSSGTVYFYMQNGKITISIFFIVSFIHYIYRKTEVIKFNIKSVVCICTYIIINTLLNYKNNINYEEVVILLIFTVGSYFVISAISFKDFKNVYINIIVVLSVISLILYFMVSYKLVETNITYIQGKRHMMYLFNNFGWNVLFGRNSGMFWEPGAFQILLNIALIFMIDDSLKERVVKKKAIKNIIIILTIISTKSTTAYLIMAILFIYYIYKGNYFRGRRKYLYPCIIPIVFIILITIINSSVVADKFDNNNMSFNARNNHIRISMDIIKQKPILGFGCGSRDAKMIGLAEGMDANSAGLLVTVIYFGIPYLIMYYILLIIGIKKKKIKPNLIITIVLVTLFYATEYFMIFPLANLFIFEFRKSEYNN